MSLGAFTAFIHFRFSLSLLGNRNSRKSKERWTSPIPGGWGYGLRWDPTLGLQTTCPVGQDGGSTGKVS